ncbi:MAG TPA: roadblock/LC7 domain-containing protein [Streptosporangiaceae bacterium]|nr:roadblock/LC7 domain-containing protein [Streptosporangiaceae bacterium]
MSPLSNEARSLTWLVNNFVAEVPGVIHAVVVSADGLLLIASEELSAEQAQQLAAVASGARSLAETSSRLFGLGECRQTIVRMERGYLFIMAISDGSCLATLASTNCDMKVVAYQMTLLVESSDHVLTPQLRRELRTEIRRERIR